MIYDDQPRGGGILVFAVILGLITLGSLLLVGLTVGRRDSSREQVAIERREAVAEAIAYACTEIEKLKAGEREAAWLAYREFDKTLKLLKLQRTPALERAARLARDRKLKRYRATPCPLSRGIL